MKVQYVKDLKKLLNYIDKNLHKGIGVADCAAYLSYSPRYSSMMFRKYFGTGLGEYLLHLRMQAAKRELQETGSVQRTAEALSYDSPDGFSRAFRNEFGILPTEYLRGGKLKERYVADFDYLISYSDWMKGENPSHGGLWKYEYFDPATGEYHPMIWTGARFEAPFERESASDPHWYCRNRTWGYGMHPGKEIRAVRTFLCPFDGEIDAFFSVGRVSKMVPSKSNTPVAVQLYRNGQPLTEAFVLTDIDAVFCKATCTVRAGDRICLHADSMGDVHGDGINLYRQRVSYRSVSSDLTCKKN